MIQKRRRHTKELKEQAVELVTEKGYRDIIRHTA